MADFDEALKYLPQEYGDISEGAVPAKYAQMGGTADEYNRAFGKLQRGKIDGRMIAAFKAQVALFAHSPASASAGADDLRAGCSVCGCLSEERRWCGWYGSR